MIPVTFVISTLAVGGAEKHLRQLVPRLRAHDLAPAVLTLRHEGRFFEELRDEGIPVRSARMRSRLDLARGIRAAAPSAGPRPALVVSQGIDAHVVGRILARRSDAGQVAIEHAGPGLGHRLHHRLAYRLLAPGMTAAIAVDDVQIPVLRSLGFDEGRLRVIPNGIEPLEPRRATAETRRELGLPEDAFVALLVATLRPEKRVEAFVAAVAAAHALDPRIRGLVAGGGPELAKARKAAEAAGGSITVLGERDDVADLVAAADVACLTSSAEGLPLAALEAMTLGRPVLAPAVGGLVGAIEDGVTGVLVPPGDDAAFTRALVHLAADDARTSALGRAARARFEDRYTVERMTRLYANVLHEALRDRGDG